MPAEAHRVGTLPLTPMWHQDALRKKREEHPRIYSRGFEHRSISEAELVFPSWRTVRDRCKGLKVADILGQSRAEWFRRYGRFGGVDLSGEERPGNAIVTLAGTDLSEGEKARHKIVPLEAVFTSDSQPALVDRLTGLFRWWDWELLLVETNGLQGQLIQWADVSNAPWSARVDGFQTTSNKRNLITGLPGIEVELARGLWEIPYGEWEDHTSACECGWCRLDREMSTYPATATTDGVMALFFAWHAFRRGQQGAEWVDVRYRQT